MKLLYAEDERSLSRAISVILEKNNYTVDTVYNGKDALFDIENNDYDAIILDIMMPEMDGISVLKEVRSKGITTPIIMLTAKGEVEDKILGLDCGANDYLPKPFDTRELLARLRAMTRSEGERTDNTLSFGNVTLDLKTYELIVENEKIKLSNKEFQMTEMLIRNPGNIISAETFIDRIWTIDSDAEINVVWVYISYLRKKFSDLNADVEIKAKRGVGYYLEQIK